MGKTFPRFNAFFNLLFMGVLLTLFRTFSKMGQKTSRPDRSFFRQGANQWKKSQL